MRLSLSGFLFEDNYNSQSFTSSKFCALAKSAGYEGVELRHTQVSLDTPKRKRRELLKTVQDAGLVVTCLTARGLSERGSERDDFFLHYLELCQDMKCSLLKIGSDTNWLRKAARKAEGHEVTLASNNHVGSQLETIEGTRQYFREINHPHFALLYDSLHLSVAGEDYLACIFEFFAITCNILVHSLRQAKPQEKAAFEKGGKRWIKALPDEPGVQNWPAVFSSFKCLGYDGLITVIETGWPTQQREYVATHCAKVIRRLWEEG